MNWYKFSQQISLFTEEIERKSPKLQIGMYNSLGEMAVYIDGKRYLYEKVSPFFKKKLQVFIDKKNWTQAFKLLKSLSEVKKEAQNKTFYPPQLNMSKNVIIEIDVKKADIDLQKDTNFYVGPHAKGGFPEKYNKIKELDKIEMPYMSIDENGQVGFLDGRHRFAYLRDTGLQRIRIVVPKDKVEIFRARYT
jgi:hypothetical protein